VDTSAWLDCWGDRILRQYLIDMVKAFSRDPVVQEDLLTTSWLHIGDCECGRTTEHMMDVGFYAMLRRYKAEYWRPVKKRWAKTVVYQRVHRKCKKYYCVVKAPVLLI